MWTCSSCGEHHEDQFKQCWKCVGAEVEQQITATPPRPKPPRKLRSMGSVLFRAAIGFGIGTLLGVAVVHRNGVSVAAASSAGLTIGLVFGCVVGIFVWVFFPYEASAALSEATDEGDAPANRFG